MMKTGYAWATGRDAAEIRTRVMGDSLAGSAWLVMRHCRKPTEGVVDPGNESR
jgi:hypothetical protein